MVKELIRDAGLGPWAAFPEWGMLADLAVAIEATIQDPVDRASFAATAVADLRATDPAVVEQKFQLNSVADRVEYLTWAAETARPGPGGSTELWGSVWQWLDN